MMPYDGRRTVTALFAFTFIIHNGSSMYRTSSNKNCKYCEYFFKSGLTPDAILKRATDAENSPRDVDDGKNFVQRSAQENVDSKFADFCKVYCRNDFQISGGSLKRESKLRGASGTQDDRAPKKRFQSEMNGKSASTVESEVDFPSADHQPSLGFDPPAGEPHEKGAEGLRVNRRVKKDSGELRRGKRDATYARNFRKFRDGVGDESGRGGRNRESYAMYNDDYNYGLRYNDGYQDYGSQQEAEDDLYDEYPSDERRQPNPVGDEDGMDVGGNGESSRGDYFGGEIAEAPGRRIWEMQGAGKSIEGKPCNCTKEFEKYMSSLLKDAFVVIKGALKQLSKWVSSLRSTPTSAAAISPQSVSGNLTKSGEGPRERSSGSLPACDFSRGFRPTEARNGEPEKGTEASFKKAAEIEDHSTESDEEESLSAFPTTRQAEREEPDTTPEPETTTELWPPNHVTLPTTTRKMDIFADEPAAWTEPVPEFTEASGTTFRPDGENSTAATAAKAGNATEANPAPTRGNAIPQPNAKASKDPPALCNLRNLKKPQFLPLILEALEYGRH